ncbi:hypothetical protein OA07_25995 [Aphanizomenon flos-aquae 2012/KM1/D3]|nr:hypothetical protein OA07_25995 [Aphanizomenon flos-aquae 2012/KM1/D3]
MNIVEAEPPVGIPRQSQGTREGQFPGCSIRFVTPDWAIILHFKDVKTDLAITPNIFTMILLNGSLLF